MSISHAATPLSIKSQDFGRLNCCRPPGFIQSDAIYHLTFLSKSTSCQSWFHFIILRTAEQKDLTVWNTTISKGHLISSEFYSWEIEQVAIGDAVQDGWDVQSSMTLLQSQVNREEGVAACFAGFIAIASCKAVSVPEGACNSLTDQQKLGRSGWDSWAK